jgi:hypothetical protein
MALVTGKALLKNHNHYKFFSGSSLFAREEAFVYARIQQHSRVLSSAPPTAVLQALKPPFSTYHISV